LTLAGQGARLACVRLFVFVCLAVAGLHGCAGGARERELAALSRTVTTLQTQLERNDARLVELSNQLFVLSDRLEAAQSVEAARAPVPTLQVVKLVPPERSAPVVSKSKRGRAAAPAEDEAIDVDLTGYDDPATLPIADVPPPPADRHDPAYAEAERLFQSALSAYREGKSRAALDGFAELVARFPSHRYADSAMYWMGEARLDAQDNVGAAEAFAGLCAKHPRSSKVPDALFKLGVAYERAGQAERARQAFSDLVTNFPHNALAELARRRPASVAQGGSR
jgi:tol-pal system protein YbgF